MNTCWLRECEAADLRASPLLRCCIFSYQSGHKIVTQTTQHTLFNIKTILQTNDIPHYSKEKEKHYFHTSFFFFFSFNIPNACLWANILALLREKKKCLVQSCEAIQPIEEPVVSYFFIILSCTLHCFCLVFLLDAQSRQASFYTSSDRAFAALDVKKKKIKKNNLHTGCFPAAPTRLKSWQSLSLNVSDWITMSTLLPHQQITTALCVCVCVFFFLFASVFLYKMYLLYC